MLVKKFEKQVEQTPKNIAVKTHERSYTYLELNRNANRIAHSILTSVSETTVGLLFEHGEHMITAILGALKAGKLYVPLSVDYPSHRIAFMLSDSQASLIVTNIGNKQKASHLSQELNIPVLVVDEVGISDSIDAGHDENPTDIPIQETAYILYTSGSTGKPKGVFQTRLNADYYNRNWIRIFNISSQDRMTLFSSFCHDGSVQDMFSALHSGATLYPLNMKNRESTFELSEFLMEEEITIWHSVPSLFSYFANTLSGKDSFNMLRYILLGGEAVRQHEVDMATRFFPEAILANVYGQTESSVNSICLIRPGHSYKRPLIGSPLDETEIFVVDEDGESVDVLGTGEILIACRHISPGYWRNLEATEQVFADDDEYGRIYWTGDLGRLLPDGNIEFMGRRDHQIKIRGFRVELGEIETALLKNESVREAVVTAREDEIGDKYLCAYIVCGDDHENTEVSELKRFLSDLLPDYMIPTFIIILEKMPLTQSNKIDRNALPEPGALDTGGQFTAPRNVIERNLVKIWKDVLAFEDDSIGIDLDFFQLGGHSLKATILTSRIHKDLGVKIPLAQVFKCRTIRKLGEFVAASSGGEKFIDVEPTEKKEYYPLSYNQKRLWVMSQADPNNTSFNMPANLTLGANVDVDAIRESLELLFHRHETFRTAFLIPEDSDEPGQFILDNVNIPLEIIDLCSFEKEETQQRIAEILIHERNTPFDLTKPPFFRSILIKDDMNHWHFIFNMHHIITDGWSQEILQRDFMLYYNAIMDKKAPDLEPLNLQYKDFAQWDNRQITDPDLRETAHRFWEERLKNGIQSFHILYDFQANDKDVSGINYRFVLKKEIKDGLKKMADNNNTTLFVVMYAAFNWLLAQYSGNKDIVCSVISAGRNHIDLQKIVGFFVNSIVAQINVDFEEDFNDFIHRTDTELMNLFQYQHYPMELVLEEKKMPYPDVSISFNMLNIKEGSESIPLKDFSSFHTANMWNVKFNLAFHTTEYENAIETRWIYKKALFKPETIEMIANAYRKLIEALISG